MSSTPDVPPVSHGIGRKVVFVVGSGRSGTSTMSGTLQALGMHVPQPEVAADETNPKGFGEPQWVVDLHDELLRRSGVQVSDARPGAWLGAGKLQSDMVLRERLHDWLGQQFAEAEGRGPGELVIKDPRLAWFLGLWRAAATRCDATASYVTMLRPVTEVVGSKQKYYAGANAAGKIDEVSRTAAWVNMMLHTERATRGSQRIFVRYSEMLSDWTVPVFETGRRFDLGAVTNASANDIRRVHAFIDPTLRRVELTWDDVQVPTRLRELAEETWQRLDVLAEPDGESAVVHAELDELRTAYAEFYEQCEGVTVSTLTAAVRRQAAAPGRRVQPQPPRAADRLPHNVRALVPARVRRGARKVLGRER